MEHAIVVKVTEREVGAHWQPGTPDASMEDRLKATELGIRVMMEQAYALRRDLELPIPAEMAEYRRAQPVG